jgi:hypothetical protein
MSGAALPILLARLEAARKSTEHCIPVESS